MKKSLISVFVAVAVVLAAPSAQALSLWSSIGDNSSQRGVGFYFPIADTGLSAGVFAPLHIFNKDKEAVEGLEVQGGFLSVDGIPVAGGVEAGLNWQYTTKSGSTTDKEFLLTRFTLGKSFMYDLTPEVQVGFYVDLMTYGLRNSGTASDQRDVKGHISFVSQLYPVISAQVNL